MRMIKKVPIVIFSLMSAHQVQAEYAIGYNVDDFDPQTHEYRQIYRDWQEGVALDPVSGNYTITYKDDGVYAQTNFEPGTKIDPILKSAWKSSSDTGFIYAYRLKNGRQSRQNIDQVMMFVSNINGGLEAPREWEGFIVPTFTDARMRLSWIYRGQIHHGGLAPGREISDFSALSPDLPGIALAQLKGAKRPTIWLGSMPDGPIGERVNQLLASDFVPRYAVAPTIVVPSPFVATPILVSLKKHVDQDLLGMKLIDPSLVTRLDPLFESAIAAAKGGNNVALRADLRALRGALSNEQGQEGKPEKSDHEREAEDAGGRAEVSRNRPVAKIAKAVLEFDLRYLERRVLPESMRGDHAE